MSSPSSREHSPSDPPILPGPYEDPGTRFVCGRRFLTPRLRRLRGRHSIHSGNGSRTRWIRTVGLGYGSICQYLEREVDWFSRIIENFRLPDLESNLKGRKGFEDLENEEKDTKVADFECNIYLDLVKEPVLTSCGHLFCWPCLYRWLHVHSNHKECPVGKGGVTESNTTPVYGRGSSENGNDPGFGILPRPRGNRLDGTRQKFLPSRRLREGFVASWRYFLSQWMRSSNSALFGVGPRNVVLSWLGSGRLTGQGLNPENMREEEVTGMPGENTDEANILDRLSSYGLVVAIIDRLAAIDRVVRSLRTGNGHGASTSLVNPPIPEQAIPGLNVAYQAPASSTIAMIEGDVGIVDVSPEPDVVKSSRSCSFYTRGERSSAASSSGSLDVDEGFLLPCKRRRSN